jgi:murein DD-endopeptidase MepM/ murein hydrolase activator NlpD
MRKHGAGIVRRGLVAVALIAVVLSTMLPALAADLRPEVSAVREGITRADEARDEAVSELAAAENALAARRSDRVVAIVVRDEAATRHEGASAARREAEAEVADARGEAADAARARDLAGRRLVAAVDQRDDRQGELRSLVVEAWKRGGDTARIAGVVDALTGSTKDVGTTMAAVERLGLGADRTAEHLEASVAAVEEDTAARDRAEAAAQAAAGELARAEDVVQQRRDEERARLAELEAAQATLQQADVRLEAAVRERGAARATLDAAVAAIDAARAAASAVRHLGGAPHDGMLSWPTDGRVTSGFGMRQHPIFEELRLHRGVDIPAPTGQGVLAAAGGVVVAAGDRGGYGLAVEIDHGGGLRTLSAHLSRIDVRAGQRVEEAQRVGAIGSTGTSTGPHLHFEVHVGGAAVDPFRYFTP